MAKQSDNTNVVGGIFELSQLNMLPGGVSILYYYQDGRIELLYNNDSLYELLNVTREERSEFAGFAAINAVHPEDRDKLKACLKNALQHKGNWDIRLHKTDGEYCWVNMKSSVVAVYPDKTALLLSVNDISELKHMEEKYIELGKTMDARVKLEEEKIRRDDSHIYAYTVTNLTKGRILNHSQYAPNAPAVSKTVNFDENIKEAMETIVYEDDRKEFARIHDKKYLLNEFLNGRTGATIEFRRRQRDGMISWVRNVLHLVEEPNTAEIFLYEYCYDINATKSVEVVTNAAIIQTFECLSSIDLLHSQTTYLSQDNVKLGKNAVIADYQEILKIYIDGEIVPEDRAMCWENFSIANLRQKLAENETYEFTYNRQLADGQVRIMRNKFVYYDKKKYRCLMMATDVTDIIKEEEENRRKNELANVMGAFPGGVMTQEAVADEAGRHRIIYCAEGVAELVGYELDEFLEIYNNHLDKLVYESDLVTIANQMNALSEKGTPLDITYRVYHKDGSMLWVHEHASLMEEEDGHKIVVAVFQNISSETKLYQNIIDSSANVIQVIDRETREVYYANARAIELAGVKDYAGMHCYEFFGHTDAPCKFCNYDGRSLEEKEITVESLDRTFLMKGNFNKWHDRSVFIENLQDITQHKKLQQDYDSYTRSVLNSAMEAAIFGRINVTNNIIYKVDSKYPNFKRLEGKCTIEQFVNYASNFTKDAEEKAAYRNMFKRDKFLQMFREGNNFIKYQHHCELSNGNIIIMQSIVQLMLNPNNGDIEGVFYSRDVTQEAISEQILKQLMNSGYEGVQLLDTVTGSCSIRVLNSKFDKVDITKISNYAENCQVSADVYIHPDDRERFLQECSLSNIIAQLEKTENYSYTVRNLLQGKITYKRCTYTYLGQGKSTIMGTIEDVTSIVEESEHQKKELQEALHISKEAAKAKNEFFSLMSHDMRTPLNGIIGLSYLLQEQDDINVIRKYILQLRNSGQYLLRLINDVLDISKIESGKLSLYPKPCDEEQLFASVIDMIAPVAKEKKILFNFETHNVTWQQLYVDEQRLKQIIVNLLSNAVKYTPQGGKVNFSMEMLERTDTSVKDRFIVEDNGIGMSKEFLPHIFESFKQEGRSNKATGSGLGMPIVKQLVEQMGGTIDIVSEINKGTTITVVLELPLASKYGEKRKEKMTVLNYAKLKGKHILLCEDHPLNAFIATKLLAKKGIEVTAAVNGKLGVEAFTKEPENHYDAILMDIRMPVMDGLEAARAIRQLKRSDAQTIPIIALSANAFEEDRLESKQAGMNAHLSKPIQVNELYKLLGEFLLKEDRPEKAQVLVVDDIEVNRAVIKVAIEDEYEVVEAENGEQALKMLEKYPNIVAVVADLHMPVMNGRELVKKIRANKAYNHIALLVNTQYGEEQQEEELMQMGVEGFIYKAVSPQIISMRLKEIMRHH